MERLRKGSFWLSGIFITLLLLAIGFLFDSTFGQLSLFRIQWPTNIYLYLILVVIGVSIGSISRNEFIKQLASISTMLPSMTVLFISGILLLIYPLGDKVPFFSYINGFPLFLLLVYVVLVSGIFISINFKTFKGLKKVVVFIPLFGYLLFVLATVNGQNDYYKMNMRIGKDRAIFEGENYDGKMLRTPFALKLLDFALPNEVVEIALRGQEQDYKLNILQSANVQDGETLRLGEYTIKVDNYFPYAIKGEDGFVMKDTTTSVHAAYISVLDKAGVVLNEGWIGTGNKSYMPLFLEVDGEMKLSLLFSSQQSNIAQVRLFETPSKYSDYSLNREESFTFKGWNISIKGFDPRIEGEGQLVDLDLIFDRWLEIKYAGLAIFILGLLALIKFR